MKKSTNAWNTAGLTLHSVRDAWSVAQTHLADVLRGSAATQIQANHWITAVNCSVKECFKRLTSLTDRKS